MGVHAWLCDIYGKRIHQSDNKNQEIIRTSTGTVTEAASTTNAANATNAASVTGANTTLTTTTHHTTTTTTTAYTFYPAQGLPITDQHIFYYCNLVMSATMVPSILIIFCKESVAYHIRTSMATALFGVLVARQRMLFLAIVRELHRRQQKGSAGADDEEEDNAKRARDEQESREVEVLVQRRDDDRSYNNERVPLLG
ncbi:hypothetical protein EDD11_000958 [Mortierella claussenii]|nr:hypothetical protein EDD11_000958 [Mortierella claussenii]